MTKCTTACERTKKESQAGASQQHISCEESVNEYGTNIFFFEKEMKRKKDLTVVHEKAEKEGEDDK